MSDKLEEAFLYFSEVILSVSTSSIRAALLLFSFLSGSCAPSRIIQKYTGFRTWTSMIDLK